MKKRKLANRGTVLKLCVGSLMAMTVLTGQPNSIRLPDTESTHMLVLSSAVSQAGAYQPNALTNPVWTQYELRIWVPADAFSGDSLCESATPVTSCGSSATPLMLTGPTYVVGFDLPQPEPPPVGLYAVSVLGLGAIGFFFGAAVPAAQVSRHRGLGHRPHSEDRH